MCEIRHLFLLVTSAMSRDLLNQRQPACVQQRLAYYSGYRQSAPGYLFQAVHLDMEADNRDIGTASIGVTPSEGRILCFFKDWHGRHGSQCDSRLQREP
jgi:hypothetical protein